jgi:hypothetical protein
MADNSETTKMNLINDITVNGITYRSGHNVEVPKKQADDLARMDHEHNQYKASLLTKHTYEVDAGTMAVGSGAQ